ncbi:MAG: hypothetical protein MUC35_06005 [Candidatus Margulisbacteria bacterium]|jgi:1-acyl-sn-glycerol-3-phosphate acyltransferase|nr:hypothetical protein [Candidatus Margulisiibacteriota bacterium]
MRWLRRLIANLYYWLGIRLLFLFFYLFSWLIAPWGPAGKVLYRQIARVIVAFFLRLGGVRIVAPGQAVLAAGRTILLVNRPCRNAPLYLVAALSSELPMVVADSLLKLWIVGRVLRTLGYIPYPRRDDDRPAAWLFAGAIYQRLQSEKPVVIYYEIFYGESRHSREKLEKLLSLAAKAGATVRPLTIRTVGEGNKPNRDIFLLGEVDLVLGKSWDPGEAGTVDRIRAFFAPLVEAVKKP